MDSRAIQQFYEQGVGHHQAGRLREAEALYRQVLAQNPQHVDAMHNLGAIDLQFGRFDDAADRMREAVKLRPTFVEAWCNLSVALRVKGRLDEAAAAAREAISLRPNFAPAHMALGMVFTDQGLFDEAVAEFLHTVAHNPRLPDAQYRLGNALSKRGRRGEAMEAYRREIAQRPHHADAQNNLGIELRSMGRLGEAIEAYRRAITSRSNFPEAHLNLANALSQLGRHEQAIASYQRAIALRPDYAQAFSNLGNVLREQGRLDEAVEACRQAIALRSDYAEAYSNLGTALKDLGQLDESVAAYRRAIALAPDDASLHSNLLIAMNYHAGYDARAIRDELAAWNLRHAEPLRKYILPHENDPSPDRRLRIGYVSADFWAHASAMFLGPLFAHHDPGQVEIFCYAEVAQPDATSRHFQRITQWRRTVGLTDEQFARQIREDRIDILVDLKLHTAANRLLVFARKPAPVQATWLGYPGSTGLGTMDYRLSDPYLDPPGTDESVYCERTIRLPETFWCYDPPEGEEIPINPLPAMEKGFVTFGCLNNFCKINDAVLTAWARVMREARGSRLLVLVPEGSARQRTLDQLGREGIDSARVEFVPRQSRADYLKQYHRIDLCLDSFPCPGHTTSFDSLWMGAPVVTLVGQRAIDRAGWSELSNIGLGELAANSTDQFVKLAVKSAGDLPRLAELRSSLRQRMRQSPLMDGPRFARNMEAAFRQMWHAWCATR